MREKSRGKKLEQCTLVIFKLARAPMATAPHLGSSTEDEVTKLGAEPESLEKWSGANIEGD